MAPRDPFEQMASIYEKAADRMDEVLSRGIDPDVEFFESLTADDLMALARNKGLAGTIDFVKRMEARRMGVTE